MVKPKFIPIFKILSTHGLKGNLKVALLSNNLELIPYLKDLNLYLKEDWEKPLKIKELKKGPGFNIYILSIEGIEYPFASSLVKKTLYLKIDDLPPLEGEEFYYYQLEGLKVIDFQDKLWGIVAEVIPMGAYELLLIKGKKKNFYLPLVEEYVEKIDFEKKILQVKDISQLVEVQA
ncbi:MAG: ribosome maturation factor RimM [Caldimicrobium sp.]